MNHHVCFAGGAVDDSGKALLVRTIDDRAEFRFNVAGIACSHRSKCICQAGLHAVIDAVLNQNTADAGAHLTVQRQHPAANFSYRPVEVSVIKDKRRCLAAKFKRDMFDGVGRIGHNDLAGARRTGE